MSSETTEAVAEYRKAIAGYQTEVRSEPNLWEAHFNLDSWGGWIWPYRTFLPHPGPAEVRVTVRNPLPKQASLEVRLVGPTGWQGTSAVLKAAPRAEVSALLAITPDGSCRRQPFAVELTADGRPFGQVAEALLTVGGEVF